MKPRENQMQLLHFDSIYETATATETATFSNELLQTKKGALVRHPGFDFNLVYWITFETS